jgi:branched-chain amino acid transport system ATP-binding protein
MRVAMQDSGGVPILEIRDLEAGYGRSVVLHGISLTINKGEIVTILGANGAGKTTILRSVLGLTNLNSGSIWLNGEEITGLKASQIVRRGVGFVPEEKSVFPSMTVRENLEMGAYATSSSALKPNLSRVLDLFPRLGERDTQKARTLSGGERKMLGIGRALMGSPDVLLLDEPSLGLAPLVVPDIFNQVGRINELGVTVLIVEQNARQALDVAGRGYVLETGQIRGQGSRQQLLANEEVRKAYLGEG